LTLSGKVNARLRDACLDEAHRAGIQLAAGAPASGTLYFLDDENYVEGPEVAKFVLRGSGRAMCRIALGKLAKLETTVEFSTVEPSDCKFTGNVEGYDYNAVSPSYDSAVVDAQFKVRAAGGNRFVEDAMRADRQRVIVNGRGFLCNP